MRPTMMTMFSEPTPASRTSCPPRTSPDVTIELGCVSISSERRINARSVTRPITTFGSLIQPHEHKQRGRVPTRLSQAECTSSLAPAHGGTQVLIGQRIRPQCMSMGAVHWRESLMRRSWNKQ